MKDHRFPATFLWGAATSAYQIEGAPLADGAGPSIWQRFSHTPGRMASGDTGDVACDHYHRWREDVGILRELGVSAYRFSIAWARVFPEGKGRVNEAGLDFYKRLTDALRDADIIPVATLYHWDLPEALDDQGGWLNRDIADWFADYARITIESLGDRVGMWATLNEPWVVTDGGYLHGALAPGHRILHEAPLASHNLMRAHGRAILAARSVTRAPVGLVVNLEPKVAASTSPEDLDATRRADAYMNRQYLDPVFFGSYPPEMADLFGEAWPEFDEADFHEIRTPVDFIGINYYTRGVTKNDPPVMVERASRVRQPRATYTETGWEVCPAALTELLVWFRERYGNIPIYITENGAAFYDPPVAATDPVEDPLRVQYLQEHIAAVGAAIDQQVDVRGYFAWSLLDNLEWSLGFTKRFGIVHVDFQTQKRTFKRSGRWYAEFVKAQRCTSTTWS